MHTAFRGSLTQKLGSVVENHFKCIKNIPNIIPRVHRVHPWGPFLPLLDEKKLPKTGSKPKTPGFTAKHTTSDLWSQAYNMYRKLYVLHYNKT